MAIQQNIIDPFHRAIHAKLAASIDDRMVRLSTGSAKADNLTTTAEKYAAQIAYIEALNDILEICADIEKEMYGDRSGSKDVAEEQG